MRKRPKRQDIGNFLDGSASLKADEGVLKEDYHRYVRRASWPLDDASPTPSMANGTNLRKPITLPLKEYEWNSLERHTKALGVQKSEWIRHAMFDLMQKEQLHFFKNRKKKEK